MKSVIGGMVEYTCSSSLPSMRSGSDTRTARTTMRRLSPREMTSGAIGIGGSSVDVEGDAEGRACGRCCAQAPHVQTNTAISAKPMRLSEDGRIMNNRKKSVNDESNLRNCVTREQSGDTATTQQRLVHFPGTRSR